MIFSLSRGNDGQAALGKLGRNGVPHASLALASAGMIVAILLAIFVPRNTFLLLYGTAVAGMFYVWGLTLVTHFRFRKAIGLERVMQLPIRLRVSSSIEFDSTLAICAIALSTFWVNGLQYSIPAFLPFLPIMFFIFRVSNAKRCARNDV